MSVAILEFCWKTSVAFNSDPQKEINFRQTSPHRRNSRRFTSIDRRRSRKSLCAEIARTLVSCPLICDTYNTQNSLEADPIGGPTANEIRGQRSPRPLPDPDDLSDVYMPACMPAMPSRHYAQNVRFFDGDAM